MPLRSQYPTPADDDHGENDPKVWSTSLLVEGGQLTIARHG